MSSKRMMVKDTDKGRELSIQINDLKKLLVSPTGLVPSKRNHYSNYYIGTTQLNNIKLANLIHTQCIAN